MRLIDESTSTIMLSCSPILNQLASHRAASSTSGPSWTASSASLRRTPRAKRRAWPTCASSSRTASTRCWPPRSCTCWARRDPAPHNPPSTSASFSTGWCWRARRSVQVSQPAFDRGDGFSKRLPGGYNDSLSPLPPVPLSCCQRPGEVWCSERRPAPKRPGPHAEVNFCKVMHDAAQCRCTEEFE